MTCHELTPLLASLGDGSLSPGEETLARAHLGGCASCRAAEGRLQKLQQLLGAGLAVPDPGEAYFRSQRDRLLHLAGSGRAGTGDSPAPAGFRRTRAARFVWAAAAAILILAAGAAIYRGVPPREPQEGPTSRRPAPSAPPANGTPDPRSRGEAGIPWIPSPAPIADQKSIPEAPPAFPPPGPVALPVAPAPSAVAKVEKIETVEKVEKVGKDAPSALGSGASARLAAMTEEAVDIGLAETPRERVVALFGAAEARLGELGQVMRQDPGLASELAGAYLLLLGEGVKSVLQDGSESPQDLALARRAAREHARGHESTLVELGAVAQGKLKGTLEEALAMSRELARP